MLDDDDDDDAGDGKRVLFLAFWDRQGILRLHFSPFVFDVL